MTARINGEAVGRLERCPVELLVHTNFNEKRPHGPEAMPRREARSCDAVDDAYIRAHAKEAIDMAKRACRIQQVIEARASPRVDRDVVAKYDEMFLCFDTKALLVLVQCSDEPEWFNRPNYSLALAQEVQRRVKKVLPPLTIFDGRRA